MTQAVQAGYQIFTNLADIRGQVQRLNFSVSDVSEIGVMYFRMVDGQLTLATGQLPSDDPKEGLTGEDIADAPQKQGSFTQPTITFSTLGETQTESDEFLNQFTALVFRKTLLNQDQDFTENTDLSQEIRTAIDRLYRGVQDADGKVNRAIRLSPVNAPAIDTFPPIPRDTKVVPVIEHKTNNDGSTSISIEASSELGTSISRSAESEKNARASELAAKTSENNAKGSEEVAKVNVTLPTIANATNFSDKRFSQLAVQGHKVQSYPPFEDPVKQAEIENTIFLENNQRDVNHTRFILRTAQYFDKTPLDRIVFLTNNTDGVTPNPTLDPIPTVQVERNGRMETHYNIARSTMRSSFKALVLHNGAKLGETDDPGGFDVAGDNNTIVWDLFDNKILNQPNADINPYDTHYILSHGGFTCQINKACTFILGIETILCFDGKEADDPDEEIRLDRVAHKAAGRLDQGDPVGDTITSFEMDFADIKINFNRDFRRIVTTDDPMEPDNYVKTTPMVNGVATDTWTENESARIKRLEGVIARYKGFRRKAYIAAVHRNAQLDIKRTVVNKLGFVLDTYEERFDGEGIHQIHEQLEISNPVFFEGNIDNNQGAGKAPTVIPRRLYFAVPHSDTRSNIPKIITTDAQYNDQTFLKDGDIYFDLRGNAVEIMEDRNNLDNPYGYRNTFPVGAKKRVTLPTGDEDVTDTIIRGDATDTEKPDMDITGLFGITDTLSTSWARHSRFIDAYVLNFEFIPERSKPPYTFLPPLLVGHDLIEGPASTVPGPTLPFRLVRQPNGDLLQEVTDNESKKARFVGKTQYIWRGKEKGEPNEEKDADVDDEVGVTTNTAKAARNTVFSEGITSYEETLLWTNPNLVDGDGNALTENFFLANTAVDFSNPPAENNGTWNRNARTYTTEITNTGGFLTGISTETDADELEFLFFLFNTNRGSAVYTTPSGSYGNNDNSVRRWRIPMSLIREILTGVRSWETPTVVFNQDVSITYGLSIVIAHTGNNLRLRVTEPRRRQQGSNTDTSDTKGLVLMQIRGIKHRTVKGTPGTDGADSAKTETFNTLPAIGTRATGSIVDVLGTEYKLVEGMENIFRYTVGSVLTDANQLYTGYIQPGLPGYPAVGTSKSNPGGHIVGLFTHQNNSNRHYDGLAPGGVRAAAIIKLGRFNTVKGGTALTLDQLSNANKLTWTPTRKTTPRSGDDVNLTPDPTIEVTYESSLGFTLRTGDKQQGSVLRGEEHYIFFILDGGTNFYLNPNDLERWDFFDKLVIESTTNSIIGTALKHWQRLDPEIGKENARQIHNLISVDQTFRRLPTKPTDAVIQTLEVDRVYFIEDIREWFVITESPIAHGATIESDTIVQVRGNIEYAGYVESTSIFFPVGRVISSPLIQAGGREYQPVDVFANRRARGASPGQYDWLFGTPQALIDDGGAANSLDISYTPSTGANPQTVNVAGLTRDTSPAGSYTVNGELHRVFRSTVNLPVTNPLTNLPMTDQDRPHIDVFKNGNTIWPTGKRKALTPLTSDLALANKQALFELRARIETLEMRPTS